MSIIEQEISRTPSVHPSARRTRPSRKTAPSVPDQSGWQPIETAPKDGTTIDLWADYGQRRLTDCWWDTESSTWRRWEFDPFCGPAVLKVLNSVTHWRRISGPEE